MRQIVVLITAVIVAAHTTYIDVRAGGVLQFVILKNLIVCTFAARWFSSLIGAIANIIMSNNSDGDGPKKETEAKKERQIPAESFSETAFPSANVKKEAEPEPVSVPVCKPTQVKHESFADRVRRADMPAVWRLRPPKQLPSRVLTIRA